MISPATPFITETEATAHHILQADDPQWTRLGVTPGLPGSVGKVSI